MWTMLPAKLGGFAYNGFADQGETSERADTGEGLHFSLSIGEAWMSHVAELISD